MTATTAKINAVRELRPLQQQELGEATHQVAAWMGFDSDRALTDTFPQVYRPGARVTRVGMFESGELVSHVMTSKATLMTGQGSLRALLIGSVATRPDHRGRGRATAVLEHVLGRAHSEGLDLVLLWSDQWDFYRRLGFEPVGRQLEVRLHFDNRQQDPAVRPARVGDLPDLLALHERKPLRVHRDLAAMALMLSAAPMETMVLCEAGSLQAYACLGKGQDFGGWWHELGGEDADIRRLLAGAMAHLGGDTATVLVPPYRTELVAGTQVPPAACALGLPLTMAGRGQFFVDGLDSI
ncbi:MAG: GNAT family N-acetyltransferase [Planctomycetota bacterium]